MICLPTLHYTVRLTIGRARESLSKSCLSPRAVLAPSTATVLASPGGPFLPLLSPRGLTQPPNDAIYTTAVAFSLPSTTIARSLRRPQPVPTTSRITFPSFPQLRLDSTIMSGWGTDGMNLPLTDTLPLTLLQVRTTGALAVATLRLPMLAPIPGALVTVAPAMPVVAMRAIGPAESAMKSATSPASVLKSLRAAV
ncbi:uncharacterized protein CC84DRAFT_1168947 [Paraphaeosphaeria sporulosa]|uniref:Uncharacterized protein n=1 Tax=Paraphaeosphaeria sporulosa TaxID=1460663 RepID=A0A177BX34_9PLEO|nr:uncharacterized protein CC84DRAFT_1168947 [Paraphaeosphaeria sporulosa]OAG00064.1 hypothetical protein CC84DRAFT_1168947 [Paraphaeosphaeria sporulosa]